MLGGDMNIQELKAKYPEQIIERILDTLYDTSVSDLIEELLHWMPEGEIAVWVKNIQDEEAV
jgi:beta-xylosidase